MTDSPLPTLLFEAKFPLRVSDINYGGHLGNDRFLTLVQDARAQFFYSMGWTEKDLAQTAIGLIVTKASIDFLNEAFLGQTLLIQIKLGKHGLCRFELYYDLIEEKTQKPVGKVWTELAFFDYQKRKVSKCPEFYEALRRM